MAAKTLPVWTEKDGLKELRHRTYRLAADKCPVCGNPEAAAFCDFCGWAPFDKGCRHCQKGAKP